MRPAGKMRRRRNVPARRVHHREADRVVDLPRRHLSNRTSPGKSAAPPRPPTSSPPGGACWSSNQKSPGPRLIPRGRLPEMPQLVQLFLRGRQNQNMPIPLRLGPALDRRIGRDRVTPLVAFIRILELHADLACPADAMQYGIPLGRSSKPSRNPGAALCPRSCSRYTWPSWDAPAASRCPGSTDCPRGRARSRPRAS